MKRAVVTGSASGIGAATAAALRAAGFTVFGIDRAGADCNVDLGTDAGRAEAIAAATAFAEGELHALVPCAGLSGLPDRPGSVLASVNFFGTIALVEGLRPVLAAAEESSVVLISSNSTMIQPKVPMDVVEACLTGDEEGARAAADAATSMASYPATKVALAWWAREHAVKPEWIGAGIRVNAIAPGMIETALVAEGRSDATIAPLLDLLPIPRGRSGAPDDIALFVAFLCGPGGRNFVGSFVTIDGGTEALLRARDWPKPW